MKTNLANISSIKLLIHGGAGTLDRSKYSPLEIKEFHQALEEALQKGFELLQSSSALDAVQAAVMVLEDCPLFNAGKGSVFNAEGRNELDAAIMDGTTLRAGAVAGVSKIKNPISAARMILEQCPHVLLVGEGAEKFCKEQKRQNDFLWVDQDYFFTEKRWQQYLEAKEISGPSPLNINLGTVGAVAIDQQGHLSAATSTGGLTMKTPGRISDSAVIGAGTYAHHQTCAISTTGKGDYFIRQVTAKYISDLMMMKGMSLQDSCQLALKELKDLGGEGGLIAVDREGHWVMEKTTPGMFRGMIDGEGNIVTEIF